MAYGVKRGVKAPGNYTFSDLLGLASASAAGIIAAIVTDYNQRGEASALYTINQWVVGAGEILGYGQIPLWTVVIGLIVAGAGSIFYFQPITRQGAFAQGFSLLAVLMTAVPADLAGSLETIAGENDLPTLGAPDLQREAVAAGDGEVLVRAAFSDQARVMRIQQAETEDVYHLKLTIDFTNGIPDDVDSMIRRGAIRGRIHNAGANETYNLFRAAGAAVVTAGDTMIIEAGVPARADSAELWIRIEANGYVIEEQSRMANLGEPLDWTIHLQPSATPLFIQRLLTSYWF